MKLYDAKASFAAGELSPKMYARTDLAPLDVGDVTLFVQRQGTTVRSIGYRLDVDGYSSNDLSIMAEHIFENNRICYEVTFVKGKN